MPRPTATPTSAADTQGHQVRPRLAGATLEAVTNYSFEPFTLLGLTTFGRSTANSLALDHPTVSKRHARIRLVDGEFILEDLGSSNGTAINGKRLSGPVKLTNGDRIAFGEVVVRIRTPSG